MAKNRAPTAIGGNKNRETNSHLFIDNPDRARSRLRVLELKIKNLNYPLGFALLATLSHHDARRVFRARQPTQIKESELINSYDLSERVRERE